MFFSGIFSLYSLSKIHPKLLQNYFLKNEISELNPITLACFGNLKKAVHAI